MAFDAFQWRRRAVHVPRRMKPLSPVGPLQTFKVRIAPFGLSLSKPFACGTRASTSSAWPFDKLRANGVGTPTFINDGSGLQADGEERLGFIPVLPLCADRQGVSCRMSLPDALATLPCDSRTGHERISWID
jgi:hypothetical protein